MTDFGQIPVTSLVELKEPLLILLLFSNDTALAKVSKLSGGSAGGGISGVCSSGSVVTFSSNTSSVVISLRLDYRFAPSFFISSSS